MDLEASSSSVGFSRPNQKENTDQEKLSDTYIR